MLKPVLALCLVGCFSFSNAQQIDNSGNLINNNNWSGAVYGADPGGCCASISGAGALYDTTTDTIMFSYGISTLSQTIGLQQALGGTGIQVHGYNYNFDYRLMPNSSLHTDNLTTSIWVTNSQGFNTEVTHLFLSGQVSLNNNDQWNSVSGTRTFQNPLLDPQSITMRFEGRDGGFWGGYYGPEVRNVSLSVNYSFDPCVADPLYSSSCPGYLEAYMAYLFEMLGWSTTPEPDVEVAAIDYSLTPSATSSVSAPEETTTGEVVVDAGGIEVSTTGELTVPDDIPQEAREKKPVDMNLISRIVREATDDSAAMAVVNQSIENSMSEAANPDSSMTSETLAAISRQTQISVEQAMADVLSASEIAAAESASSTTQDTSFTQQETAQGGITFLPDTAPASIAGPATSTDTDTAFTDAEPVATDTPATELVVASPVVRSDDANTITANTVRRDVTDNDAAGGVGIEDLAQEPQDFTAYVNKQLADAQFYQTEAIYRDLEPVDNRRSLRLLSGANDRLHQDMVNDQYRRR
jgi:hypothetical protein